MQLWEGYVTVHFEKEKLLKIKPFFFYKELKITTSDIL